MSSSQYQLYIRSSLWECQEHHSLLSISLLCNQRCRCYTQLSSSVVTSDIWWVWAIMVTWMLFVSTYVLKEARVHRHHILSHLPVRYSDFRHLFLPIDLRQVVKCYYGVFISVSIYTSFNICMLVELCILSHLIPAVSFGIYLFWFHSIHSNEVFQDISATDKCANLYVVSKLLFFCDLINSFKISIIIDGERVVYWLANYRRYTDCTYTLRTTTISSYR